MRKSTGLHPQTCRPQLCTRANPDPVIKVRLEALFDARWAETQRQREMRAAEYDHARAMARLKLLSAQADAGFMRHVLANPASDAQRDKATEFLAAAGQEIKALGPQVGDPDAIPDKHGDLPAARRGYNLDSHMRLFRHEALRAWSKEQRPRFRQLLAMPVPQVAGMCPECLWGSRTLLLVLPARAIGRRPASRPAPGRLITPDKFTELPTKASTPF